MALQGVAQLAYRARRVAQRDERLLQGRIARRGVGHVRHCALRFLEDRGGLDERLFGRDQDIALQRTRHSINERLHLRLWLTPLTFEGKPVWVGQVSRDIGVRFTTRAWNLTTHRIDPNVDESRDYVIEDLVQARRVAAAGYVDGVGGCPATSPKRNLTGDPYFTDGKRAVIMVSANRTP